MAAPAWRTHVCHGTPRHPGVLVGVNLNVIVRGVCLVNHGPVGVSRNVIIQPGSALVAAYGLHNSRLQVAGNILVRHGGTLVLGCEPVHATCIDDPHKHHPTLSSHDSVGGSIVGLAALGMVVHNTWIGHNVVQTGGGGGLTCRPHGVVFIHLHSPVFSAWEDNWVNGNMLVRGLRSCWLGVIRNWVGGSVAVTRNRLADPDATEIVSNSIHGNLLCWRNRPRAQFGDSRGTPNRVGMHAFLECSFRRILPNPANQHHHFSHISVPMWHR